MKMDEKIQKDVMDALKWEPMLTVSEIGVAVKNQIVTLSGTVDTYSKKSVAEVAAKRVAGVKAVALDIEVRLSSIGKRSDTEIAQAVVNALQWDTQVPAGKIIAKVEEGWVTLDGNLEWSFQKTAAYNAVKNLYGLKGIINNLKIVSGAKPNEIKQSITKAFKRSATLDANKIDVETFVNKVILSGTVRTLEEKKDAEEAAFAAPGITEVENNIIVEPEILIC
jgi:osmotically-inducible protein OsmY